MPKNTEPSKKGADEGFMVHVRAFGSETACVNPSQMNALLVETAPLTVQLCFSF
jgi:hypothetical protein